MLTITHGARLAAAFTIVAIAALAGVPPFFDGAISEARRNYTALGVQQDTLGEVLLSLSMQVAAIRGFLLNGDPALIYEYREARTRQASGMLEMQQSVDLRNRGFDVDVTKLHAAIEAWSEIPEAIANEGVERAETPDRISKQQVLYRSAIDAGKELQTKIRAQQQKERAIVLGRQEEARTASQALVVLAIISSSMVLFSLRRTLAQGELARRDPLTGLYNRRGFVEAAQLLMRRATRAEHQMTLVVFDLDGFKRVNDVQGHAAGDELLKSMGTILNQTARRSDLVGRLGGDEFAILLEHAQSGSEAAVVRRLRDEVQARLDEAKLPVTLSVGAVLFEPAGADLEELSAEADRLMYDAKKAGKNTIRLRGPGESRV